MRYKNLNPDALEDLYICCLNAMGAYDALETLGADKALPGFAHCRERLEAALKKAKIITQKDITNAKNVR